MKALLPTPTYAPCRMTRDEANAQVRPLSWRYPPEVVRRWAAKVRHQSTRRAR